MFYSFIVNTNSGNGHGQKVWKQVKEILDRRNEQYEVHFTEAQGDASRLSSELSESLGTDSCIIAIGGDGTMNEVVSGADLDTGVCLSYIPSGSGNDLHRGVVDILGKDKTPEELFEDHTIVNVDYGVLSTEDGKHRRFIVSAGAGFDAGVCFELNDSKLKAAANNMNMGKIAYTLIGAKQYFGFRTVKGYLVLDGSKRVELNRLLFISFHIHPYEGGGYKFGPHADPHDGLIALTVVNGSPWHHAVNILGSKLRPIRERNGVKMYQANEIEIHLEKPVPIHTDGETPVGYQKDFDVRCVSGKLKIMR